MTSLDAEFERLHSPKQELLSLFPRPAVSCKEITFGQCANLISELIKVPPSYLSVIELILVTTSIVRSDVVPPSSAPAITGLLNNKDRCAEYRRERTAHRT